MPHSKDAEAKLLASIHEVFAEKIPFNKVLGLDVVSLAGESPVLRFAMRPELVGNYMRGNLHGGVISSVIDVCGGLTAFLGLQKKLRDEPIEERLQRFARIGTIDMRVDYLRKGEGEFFVASGSVLRRGNKVAVVRTELVNDQGLLIAAGTGTYLVG
jgi:uncharacterized protein (TIGR00369 family)